MKKRFYPILSLILALIIWQLAVIVLHIPDFILPTPTAVLTALIRDMPVLASHALVTTFEALLGLVLASALAFLTALAIDRWESVNLTLYPWLVISQTIPVMVLGPILVLWFGFGLTPKIILVFLMSYFPIVIAFSEALRKVSAEKILFLRLMGAKSWQIYTLLKIPASMPAFFAGAKIAATYCVSGAIVGEWLSAKSGLGYYMIRVKNGYQIDKVFAAIICVIIISLGFNVLVVLTRKTYNYYLLKRGTT